MELLANGQKHIPLIYGGMGMGSHIYFESKVLRLSNKSGAQTDQQRPFYILINGSPTPDRTKFIEDGQEDPTPVLISLANTYRNGCDFMMVICNTAHHFYDRTTSNIKFPWINLIDITSERIAKTLGKGLRVGVLGTNGTVKTRLFDTSLERFGLKPVGFKHGTKQQEQLHEAIYDREYGIKSTGDTISGKAAEIVNRSVHSLKHLGIDAVIPGCTELSMALNNLKLNIPVIDPLEVAAEVMIEIAYGDRSVLAHYANLHAAARN